MTSVSGYMPALCVLPSCSLQQYLFRSEVRRSRRKVSSKAADGDAVRPVTTSGMMTDINWMGSSLASGPAKSSPLGARVRVIWRRNAMVLTASRFEVDRISYIDIVQNTYGDIRGVVALSLFM